MLLTLLLIGLNFVIGFIMAFFTVSILCLEWRFAIESVVFYFVVSAIATAVGFQIGIPFTAINFF